jgi:hypothetical protein
MSKIITLVLLIPLASTFTIRNSSKPFLPPANRGYATYALPGASLSSEYGSFYQGDIRLLPEQRDIIEDKSPIGERTGIIHPFYRWPKNSDGMVIVPYVFDYVAQFCKEFKNCLTYLTLLSFFS